MFDKWLHMQINLERGHNRKVADVGHQIGFTKRVSKRGAVHKSTRWNNSMLPSSWNLLDHKACEANSFTDSDDIHAQTYKIKRIPFILQQNITNMNASM